MRQDSVARITLILSELLRADAPLKGNRLLITVWYSVV